MKNRFSSNLTLLKPAIRCSNDPCRAVYRVPFCLLPFSLASFSPQPSIYCQVPPHSRTLGSRVVRESLEAWTGISLRMQWSWGRTGTSGQAGSGLGRDSQGSRGESEVSGERWAQGRADSVCSKRRRGRGCCSESWPGVEGSEPSGSKAKGRRNCKAGVSWGKKEKAAQALWYMSLPAIATHVCRKGGASGDLSPWEGLRPLRVQGPCPPRDSVASSGLSVSTQNRDESVMQQSNYWRTTPDRVCTSNLLLATSAVICRVYALKWPFCFHLLFVPRHRSWVTDPRYWKNLEGEMCLFSTVWIRTMPA